MDAREGEDKALHGHRERHQEQHQENGTTRHIVGRELQGFIGPNLIGQGSRGRTLEGGPVIALQGVVSFGQ